MDAMNSKDALTKELTLCLELWKKNGGCSFGGGTKCHQCATPYLLLKLINGELLHGTMKRLILKDWQEKLNKLG